MPPRVEGGQVETRTVARRMERGTRFVATCATAGKVVRRAARTARPEFTVQGFRCVAEEVGDDSKDFTCTFRGADNPTFARITFRITYVGGLGR